ncbi:MAG: hypothetical protein ACI8TP_004024 [Acidimicrobiales bacterium]|jgi:hypothetical protein
MTYKLTLQTAPGTGILARSARAVLFVPTPGDGVEKLLAAFTEADEGEVMTAVADAIVGNDFTFPPFTCVTVNGQISLRAFGEIDLQTDQRSVPKLSGRGSSTWVDHVVHGTPDAVHIGAGEGAIDQLTDIKLGIVHAGAFVLLASNSSGGSKPLEVPDPSMASLDPPVVPEPPAPPAEPRPVLQTAQERSELVEYVLGAFPEEDNDIDPSAMDLETYEPMAAPTDLEQEPAQSLPPVGRLVFDQGEVVEFSSTLILGRNPRQQAEETGHQAVIVAGDRVSRSHLTVWVREDSILVEDCGSRNGSVVVASSGQPPEGLAPSTATLIEPGATVYIGSRSFALEAP